MAFINKRLNDCVAYGFTGGPEYNTLIVPLDNGLEQRNEQWLYPKHRYSAQYMNLRPNAADEILAAFHAMRGALHACRFKDHNDYSGTNQPFYEDGEGVWRMVKEYTLGEDETAETTLRLIQAPVVGSIVLSGGGSLANLDFQRGVYNGDATGLTWSGEFDVWVRFANDYNAFTIGNWQAHTADIELIEDRRE